MRVFLDTNVLVSAFASRGLCADVLRHVLSEHSLVVSEIVLKELRDVLRKRLRVPAKTVAEIERFLREQEVVLVPREMPEIAVRDPDDLKVLASAVAASTDVLVTGDHDLLDVASKAPVRILDPRGFWKLLRDDEPIEPT